jgi:hypothetical protein
MMTDFSSLIAWSSDLGLRDFGYGIKEHLSNKDRQKFQYFEKAGNISLFIIGPIFHFSHVDKVNRVSC